CLPPECHFSCARVQATQSGTGSQRFLFTDNALNLGISGPSQEFWIERQGAYQQLIQKGAKRVDVVRRVHTQSTHLSLLRAHIRRRSNQHTALREHGFLSKALMRGFRHSEIDNLRQRLAVQKCHKHVRWFDISMNDSFLMRVLDRAAYLQE